VHRRSFLRTIGLSAGALGTAGTAALLAACSSPSDTAGGAGGPLPQGEPALNVINASFETLTGQDRRFAFGVTTLENEPVTEGPLEVYLREVEGEILAGPLPAEFYDQGGSALGVWLTSFDVPDPGIVELIAVNGDRHGAAALRVVSPEQAQAPVPGAPAVSVPTPTTADDLGFATICTADPPCGMHETSLDTALAEGRPAVVLFATPAFCQTAVCGPAVGTVDQIRQSRQDAGDVAWIHCEVYTDNGQTLAPQLGEEGWGLPTEPWLFTIGADGVIRDRLDGPMVDVVVEDMASALVA